MSERWKYQIKIGLIWGIILSVILMAIDLFENSFEDVFFSKINLLRTLYFIVVGIFLLGYLSWKKKIKRDKNANLSNDNAINK